MSIGETNNHEYTSKFPLAQLNFSDKEAFGSNAIIDLTDRLYKYLKSLKDEMNHKTNVKAKMTKYDMHKTSEDFKMLSEMAMHYANSLTKTKFDLYTVDCWGAVYGKGDWTVEHNHVPHFWSWVYYVRASKGCSPIIFTEANLTIQPKDYDLIIFPSWIRHEVPKTESSGKRIVIAGNINSRHS